MKYSVSSVWVSKEERRLCMIPLRYAVVIVPQKHDVT